jgi:tetratricopeptide (TPR) repeat protein
VTDRVRQLWNFDDLDGTEERFQDRLTDEADSDRAEILSQLARIQGLRGDFDAGERLVDEAQVLAGDDERARARIDLERGRLRHSRGNREAALSLFESAFAIALEAGEVFVAADAAHMAALAASDREAFVAWTERGIELATAHGDASYWLGPLLNNLGWELYEAGELDAALDAFERALEAREQEPENQAAIEIARYALGKTLRALGRPGLGIPYLERAVAWAEDVGVADGWFHEELAEEYASVGRLDEARDQARLALPLLEEADPAFIEDPERAARLRDLAHVDA